MKWFLQPGDRCERQSTSPDTHTHTHPALPRPTWRAQVTHKFVTRDTTGQPRFLGDPEQVGTSTEPLLCQAKAWSLHSPAYGVSCINPTSAPPRPSWSSASPSSSATSPCPFSPSRSYCEVRILCLRHLGLLPWKQGRIKAGARSAGIRPLRYLSSRLGRFPQGPGCLSQGAAARRPLGRAQGQGGPGGAPRPART